MTDADVAIKSALEQLFPVRGEPDWDEVIAAARRDRAGSRRQLALAVALAALVAITIVTPLGAEIARGRSCLVESSRVREAPPRHFLPPSSGKGLGSLPQSGANGRLKESRKRTWRRRSSAPAIRSRV